MCRAAGLGGRSDTGRLDEEAGRLPTSLRDVLRAGEDARPTLFHVTADLPVGRASPRALSLQIQLSIRLGNTIAPVNCRAKIWKTVKPFTDSPTVGLGYSMFNLHSFQSVPIVNTSFPTV